VVFEHITTREAAQYVAPAPPHRGHHHRAPPALQPQRHLHRRPAPALLLPAGAQARSAPPGPGAGAATSGSPKFFLGTDSAPHAAALKEQRLRLPAATPRRPRWSLYAEAFEAAGALDKLEGFASFHGPDFYGLPRNSRPRHPAREPWQVPETLPFGDALIKPLRGGDTLNWKLL
jgi:dihydroorotase